MVTYASQDERTVLLPRSDLLSPAYPLSPAQEKARDAVLDGLRSLDAITLQGEPGKGKTCILTAVVAASHGAVTGLARFMELLKIRPSVAIEETFIETIEEALDGHDLVAVDDLHLVQQIAGSRDYPRKHLLDAALKTLLEDGVRRGKKFIFAVDGEHTPESIAYRTLPVKIGNFRASDYRAICNFYLPLERRIDFEEIYRFAPKLNAHQLHIAATALSNDRALDTERFIAFLRARNMSSNVELDEVPAVDWKELKGVDDVIQSLETKIAFPFENAELSARFALKPKRGVLLAGPPGTGKTTIGRALAHRLKSKFFLVDGTVVAGSGDFYCEIGEIFEAAKRNAPSVIFIDDADVIFEDNRESGFYRYLLTMLDGLKSASASRVCVMMTAMDVSSLPAALVRSGRIELWLETRLPDQVARETIFRECLVGLPDPFGLADAGRLARASSGLSGADLKAAVEDGKLQFAHDGATQAPQRPAEEYFLEAIETVKVNRRNYGRRKAKPFGGDGQFGFERSMRE